MEGSVQGASIKDINWLNEFFPLEGVVGIISSSLLTSVLLIPRFKVMWQMGDKWD